MIGPRMLLRIAATVLLAGTLLGRPGPTEAVAAREESPLAVTIDAITPGAIPKKGPLEISGTVTNTSDEAYHSVNVYALTSAAPMTTQAELAAAAELDLDVQVGTRITTPGSFADVDELAPGERVGYSIRLRRSLLPTTPGVYWLGIHALGETTVPRDAIADGKARTFIPLVPDDAEPLDTALVLPLRHAVGHDVDGRLSGLDGWAESLAVGGDLSRIVELGDAAGGRPLTWIVDPAVPDAIARLAARNPPRFLGPSKAKDRSNLAGLTERTQADAGAETGESSALQLETARLAKQWLATARLALAGDDVLALPYGDLDLPAVAALDPGLYRLARRRGSDGLPALGLASRPVAAPPGGWLDEAGLDLVPRRTPVLVTDRLLRGDQTELEVPGVVRGFGRRLVVSSSATATGGPDPGSRLDPLALRQRILAEAALRLIGGGGPLVVTIPTDIDPGTPTAAQSFFTGLDVPWLHLTTLSLLNRTKAPAWDGTELAYPAAQTRQQLTPLDLEAARRLAWTGRLLDAMLPDNATISVEVQQEALASVSYAARETGSTARLATDQSRAALRATMARVSVDAAPVTLSSAEGTVVVSVSNQLEQPVRIRLVASTDSGLSIASSDPIDLAPGERSTQHLAAKATRSGVHNVDLHVADEAGRPVGGVARFQLRSSQVSQVIWVVFAVGGALLFSAIGVRLYRRIRDALRRRKARA